jgi:hypothetical protein
MKQLLSKRWAILPMILLIIACAPSQTVPQMVATETQTAIPTTIPTVTIQAIATVISTATTNPCTDFGWADIKTDVTEFQFQIGNFANGVIVSEYLKTLRSIREKIANVTINACTEHARGLVLSSMDNRISAQEMMMTGKFDDPNALTDAMMKELPLMEAANAELVGLGLQVTLPMPGSVPVTLPVIPSIP